MAGDDRDHRRAEPGWGNRIARVLGVTHVSVAEGSGAGLQAAPRVVVLGLIPPTAVSSTSCLLADHARGRRAGAPEPVAVV